jgi:hypothetical protein
MRLGAQRRAARDFEQVLVCCRKALRIDTEETGVWSRGGILAEFNRFLNALLSRRCALEFVPWNGVFKANAIRAFILPSSGLRQRINLRDASVSFRNRLPQNAKQALLRANLGRLLLDVAGGSRTNPFLRRL